MPPAPKPANEPERLKNLYKYYLLNTENEALFDSITSFASSYFKVPIALISLIDKDQQWFKSCVGLDLSGTHRDTAICAYTILADEPLVIEDTWLDDRLRDNSLVTSEPYIRFYAGVPLHTQEGYNIGTLCLIDTQPRQISQAELEKLKYLTGQVITRIQLRLAAITLQSIRFEANASKSAQASA